jgi:hypothetical protein
MPRKCYKEKQRKVSSDLFIQSIPEFHQLFCRGSLILFKKKKLKDFQTNKTHKVQIKCRGTRFTLIRNESIIRHTEAYMTEFFGLKRRLLCFVCFENYICNNLFGFSSFQSIVLQGLSLIHFTSCSVNWIHCCTRANTSHFEIIKYLINKNLFIYVKHWNTCRHKMFDVMNI